MNDIDISKYVQNKLLTGIYSISQLSAQSGVSRHLLNLMMKEPGKVPFKDVMEVYKIIS